MSRILSFQPESGWNYSDPQNEDYMPSITGTIVEINEVQSRNYATKELETWPDGNPKLNIQFIVQGQSGKELPWVFSPKSLAADAVKAALLQYNPNATGFGDLGGLMVRITTQGDRSQYHSNNPRPWWFEILGQGQVPFRGVHEFKQQAPVQQAPAPMQQQVPPPIVNGMYAAPTVPQQPVPPSPLNRPIQQQAPAPQQYQQPMQQVPQQQQQPVVVGSEYGLYDSDMPF